MLRWDSSTALQSRRTPTPLQALSSWLSTPPTQVRPAPQRHQPDPQDGCPSRSAQHPLEPSPYPAHRSGPTAALPKRSPPSHSGPPPPPEHSSAQDNSPPPKHGPPVTFCSSPPSASPYRQRRDLNGLHARRGIQWAQQL